MTRSAWTSAFAVFDLVDDGYEENDFAVAGSSVGGENVNAGFSRRVVDVEVMKVWGVSG